MEIEAKMALTSEAAASLRQRLGKPERVVRQRDVYLATAGLPVALRLREDGDRACVTLKAGFAKVDGIRMREELEPTIRPEEAEMWLAIFGRLGFPPGEEVAKAREEYTHADIHVVIDQVDGLGLFCEVEVVGDDPEGAKASLEAAMKELGLADLPRITDSYRELLRKRAPVGQG